MTKVEFVKKYAPAKGAKFEPSAGFLKITHTCGCILTISQDGHGNNRRYTDEWADLCYEHSKQYNKLYAQYKELPHKED